MITNVTVGSVYIDAGAAPSPARRLLSRCCRP